MQWLSEIYAVVFILKSLDQKNTTQWKWHFGTLKGKGKYCNENIDLQSTFMPG